MILSLMCGELAQAAKNQDYSILNQDRLGTQMPLLTRRMVIKTLAERLLLHLDTQKFIKKKSLFSSSRLMNQYLVLLV